MEPCQDRKSRRARLLSGQSEKNNEGWDDTTPPPASYQDGKDPDSLLAAQTAENKANKALQKVSRLGNRIENQTVSADDAQNKKHNERTSIEYGFRMFTLWPLQGFTDVVQDHRVCHCCQFFPVDQHAVLCL